MNIWDWFNDCRFEWQDAGDDERLRLVDLHHEGFRHQETDPETTLALFTEGRQLAQKLNEPWWVLFYDVWRVIAYLSYLRDFKRGLELAVACAVEVRKPQFAGHPWRIACFNELTYAYVNVDPVGYAEQIQQTLDFLETEIPPGPNDDRLVMMNFKRNFYRGVGRYEDAYQTALAEINLAHSDQQLDRSWYAVAGICALCWICWKRGAWDEVAHFADATAEMASLHDNRQAELAEATAWHAVLARRQGDEERARRAYRRAAARMGRLGAPANAEYFDALCLFHEMAGGTAEALRARDRELAALDGRGQLAYECDVHLERCRLKKALGRLTADDVATARRAAGLLKQPARWLARIEALI
jgi:hypothetical protein